MITSVQNNKVKQWKKLKMKKERQKQQIFMIEGFHLVEEAVQSDWNVVEVIANEDVTIPDFLASYEIHYVTDNVFQSITETKTPQGIAAVVEMTEPKWADVKKIVLVDSIQDPGNLGTLIRTADAAGFDSIVLGDGTVDLYNEKVIRATQGSMFHIPIFQKNLEDIVGELNETGFEVWASTLEGAEPYHSVSVPEKVALILGNEGSGIDLSLIHRATKKVHIPIYGGAESLNVSIAAGILLYHIANKNNE